MAKENTAVAVIKDLDIAALMKQTGQQTYENTTYLPRLKINKDGEDDNGNTTPVGYFTVTKDGVAIFGKSVSFRALVNSYQYSVYSAEEQKYTNRSIIFKSFADEAIDELGGVACGKISKKKLGDNPSKSVLDVQKTIKCYRLVYGIVSFDGVDAAGNSHSVVDYPCFLKLSGVNFMPIGEVFDMLSRKKLLMLNHNLEFNSKRQKVGTNVFYELLVKPDLEHPVQLTKESFIQHMETVKVFQDIIDNENQQIATKYRASKKSALSASMEEMKVVSALDDDLRDEDPIDV